VIINLITEAVGDEKSEAAFVASMSGLVGFTRQAARELDPHGIRVYALENTRDTIIANVLALFE
jgi:NAD(P)-dependent dehydrogenase (short-subunit alcohol dehydrogenase family)